MVISVIYNDGKVCTTQAEPVGIADQDTTCASMGLIQLIEGMLVFKSRVLSCVNGEWRGPKYVCHRETMTCPGHKSCGQYIDDGSTSWVEEKVDNWKGRYILMTAAELEGAVSVTIDGVLMYVDEGAGLVPVIGGGTTTQAGPELQKERATSTTKPQSNYNPVASSSLNRTPVEKGVSK